MNAKNWIAMAEGKHVVTSPCIQPFSEAIKRAHTSEEARRCQFCLAVAIVDLAPHILARQPDETTHVCHPVFGGCNRGFVREI